MAAMWHLKLDGMNYGLLLVATHYKKGRKKKSFGPGSFLLGEEKNNRKRAWNQERVRKKKKKDFVLEVAQGMRQHSFGYTLKFMKSAQFKKNLWHLN